MTPLNAEARLSLLAANTQPPPPLPPTRAGGSGGFPEPAHRREIARTILEMAGDPEPPKSLSPSMVWQRSELLRRRFRTANATLHGGTLPEDGEDDDEELDNLMEELEAEKQMTPVQRFVKRLS